MSTEGAAAFRVCSQGTCWPTESLPRVRKSLHGGKRATWIPVASGLHGGTVIQHVTRRSIPLNVPVWVGAGGQHLWKGCVPPSPACSTALGQVSSDAPLFCFSGATPRKSPEDPVHSEEETELMSMALSIDNEEQPEQLANPKTSTTASPQPTLP